MNANWRILKKRNLCIFLLLLSLFCIFFYLYWASIASNKTLIACFLYFFCGFNSTLCVIYIAVRKKSKALSLLLSEPSFVFRNKIYNTVYFRLLGPKSKGFIVTLPCSNNFWCGNYIYKHDYSVEGREKNWNITISLGLGKLGLTSYKNWG